MKVTLKKGLICKIYCVMTKYIKGCVVHRHILPNRFCRKYGIAHYFCKEVLVTYIFFMMNAQLCKFFEKKKIDDNTKHNKHIVKMLTLQEYIGKVNKLLIFSFPIFVLFCILFVSHMPAPTELKNPPPKMEKPLIYEVKSTRVRL